MNRQEAFEELKKFRDEYLIGRSKIREIRSFFKFNPDEPYYICTVNDAPVKIKHELFWDIVTATDINTVCSVTFNQFDEDSAENTDCNEFDVKENSKIRKDNLALKNKLLFERNNFNKKLREISSLEELNRELIECIKKIKPQNIKNVNKSVKLNSENTDVLVCHIGDWHLGEISNEFKDVGFDMEIASKRIKKYAEYIKNEVVTKKINKIVIMCGGDICNNVTLLSKRLLQTSNRAVTTIMAVILLKNFITDLYSVCKNITFAGVGSNEARYDENYFEDEYLITNCADYVVYNMLELIFEDISTIKFLQGRNNEKIVNINGQNFLLTHGVAFAKGDVEKAVQQAISRYSVKDVNIRYVLLSHIHCARNSSYFSRNGGLVGSNAYSNSTLNLQTRASQNVLIVSKNEDINAVAVDLENIEGVTGYDISGEIEKFALKGRDIRKDLDIIQVA